MIFAALTGVILWVSALADWSSCHVQSCRKQSLNITLGGLGAGE
jgi:hypothetical protein